MGEHLHFWPTRWVNYTHACVMISRVASILCTELGFTCQPAPKLCQVDNGVIKKIAHCVLQIQDDNDRTVYLDFKRFDGYLEHGDTIEVFHRAPDMVKKIWLMPPGGFEHTSTSTKPMNSTWRTSLRKTGVSTSTRMTNPL